MEQDCGSRRERRGPDAFAVLCVVGINAQVVLALLLAIRRQCHNHAGTECKEENACQDQETKRAHGREARKRRAKSLRQDNQEKPPQNDVDQRVQSNGPAIRKARVPHRLALVAVLLLGLTEGCTILHKVRVSARRERRRRQCQEDTRTQKHKEQGQCQENRQIRNCHLCLRVLVN